MPGSDSSSELLQCCAEFSTKIVGGKVKDVTLGGTICVGAQENCADGKPDDLNLLAAVTMSYAAPDGASDGKASWLLTAKVSSLDIRKAVSIIAADATVAKKIPDIIANIRLSAIQDGCEANSPIDDCYFLIVVTDKSFQPDAVPILLQPGLSITAKLTMPLSSSPSLLSFTLPLPGKSQVYAPGESTKCICSSVLYECQFGQHCFIDCVLSAVRDNVAGQVHCDSV